VLDNYVFNGHGIYIYSAVLTQQSNPPISQINRPCNECLVNVPMQ